MQAVASLRDRIHDPATTNQPDAVLVERIQMGDESALTEAYHLHGKAVFAAAYAVTRRKGLAEDMTQEVFVRLWKRSGRFDPRRGSLRSFLKIDARGRAIDALRSERARRDRESREATLQTSAPPVGIEESVMAKITSSKIREALDSLKSEERIPLALAYFDGRSYREVAALLELPEGTVKSRIRSGLGRLRGLLRTEGIEAV